MYACMYVCMYEHTRLTDLFKNDPFYVVNAGYLIPI